MNSTNSIKTHYEITLSHEALAGVEIVAKKLNLSVSELLEGVGSGRLAIVDPEEIEDIEDYLERQIAMSAAQFCQNSR